jgi:hypothetical protein
MVDNYHNYTTDQEMQKLVPLSFREAMPQIVSSREANKLEREIEARINHASDSLIGIAKTQAQAGTKIPTEQVTENINNIISGLQLTSSQKDKVVTNAITTSRSQALIDASKMWTGDRKTSLYERTGSIQKLDEQLQSEAISLEAVALSAEFNTIRDNIMSGDVTIEAGLDMIDKRNKQLNGKFATRGAINSIYTAYNKQIASNTRIKRVKEVLSDQQLTDASEFKVKERQAGYKGIYTDLITKAQEEAKNVPAEKQGEFLQTKVAEAVARVSDMAVTKDDVVNPFVNVLSNLATSNIAARQQTGDKGELTLDSTTKQAIQILDAMPKMAKYKHLEAVGGKEARTIRAFMAYRDRGISEPQALSMAQSIMTNPVPIDYKRVSTGVEEVRDNLEFLWNPDFDDNQAAYLESEIRNQVSLSPEPDDESNIDLVTEYFKKGWTTAGSLRLKGSEGYLSRAMMLNGDKIETAMKGVVWSQRDVWLPQIQALGLDEEDVFPITDPKRGTVQIIARSKATNANIYLGKPMPLKDVKKMAAKYKVNQEKLADEYRKSFKDTTIDDIISYEKEQAERQREFKPFSTLEGE